MDRQYPALQTNEVRYAFLFVAILVVVVLSLVVQIFELHDECQVALARAARAAVQSVYQSE